jgi:hypothetical protein
MFNLSPYETMTIIFGAGFFVCTLGYINKEFKTFNKDFEYFKTLILQNFEKLEDKVDEVKLEQVQHQSITNTKVDQIQHDIKNIRGLNTVKNNLIERIEKSTLENLLKQQMLEEKINNIERERRAI